MIKNSLLTALILSAGFFQPVSACTGIRMTATDGSVVYGRTLEFGIPMPTDVITVPKGTSYTGTTALNKQNGKTWKTQYAFVGAAPFQYPHILDGVNTEGLAIGVFLFPGYAKYQTLTKANQQQALAPWELGTFILSQCATIDEVKKIMTTVTVVPVVVPEMGDVPPVHYVITDAKGNSLVIEYVNSELKTYDNPIGVITNSPTFDWHITNLNNYVNLTAENAAPSKFGTIEFPGFGQGTGMLGLRGDFTPPSRFVRAVFFSQTSVPSANANDTVFQLFHILNQFDIPKGSVRGSSEGQKDVDYTTWTSVNNLKERKFYYRTYFNPEIKMVDLNKVDFSQNKITRTPMTREDDQPQITETGTQ